jgi:hypothetical protein
MLSKELLGRQLGNVALAWGNVTWATVLLLLATVRCLRIASRSDDGEEVTRVAPQ